MVVPRFSWGPPLFVLDAARSLAAARSLWPGCLWPHGCSGRRRARPPARLGGHTSFGAVPRSPPVPSGLSGALHTSGAWLLIRCVVVKPSQATPPPTGTAARPHSSPRLEASLWLWISNFARNSLSTHSNFEFASLELQRFWGVSKNDRDKLRAKCGRRWHRRRPWVPQPSPAAHGCRSLAPPPTGVEVWPRLGPTGLALAFTHIAAELYQFRMQFPHDSFKL